MKWLSLKQSFLDLGLFAEILAISKQKTWIFVKLWIKTYVVTPSFTHLIFAINDLVLDMLPIKHFWDSFFPLTLYKKREFFKLKIVSNFSYDAVLSVSLRLMAILSNSSEKSGKIKIYNNWDSILHSSVLQSEFQIMAKFDKNKLIVFEEEAFFMYY